MNSFIIDENLDYFIDQAQKASLNAYAPYSHFHVGCVIVLDDHSIYTGANIENVSYSATICAERVAMSLVVNQRKNHNIKALIVASNTTPPSSPCGVCRQFMSEFLSKDVPIILTNGKDNTITTMKELFPMAFITLGK